MDEPLLAVRRLGIEFSTRAGRRTAVRDLDITVSAGRVVALVGESGSGKSVTAMSLLGLLPTTAQVSGSAVLGSPERGRVELIGADRTTLQSVRGGRIGTVFQEPFTAFNPVLRLGDQLIEALRAHRELTRSHAEEEALHLLGRVGLPDPLRIFSSFPHQVSGGQLQRTMIAMAISGRPELLIADEPTTALDVTVQAGILDLLRELRDEEGTAILLITHDMGVVADLADDVVVLRDGVVQETGTVDAVFASPSADYTRMLLAAVPRIDARPTTKGSVAGEVEPAARVDGVTVAYGSGRHGLVAVDDVSLVVPAGRTLGLVGESGSGKTTLGKALARLVPVVDGSIVVAGRDLASLGTRELRAARSRIGFVFQNPAESLNPRARVGAVIAEPLALHTDLTRAGRRARAADLLARVSLPADAIDRYPHELSGGERQRVAIARALALEPSLVIADEPTSALDVSVQARILDLFATLQAELGFGCLFISHDLAVVRAVSQRIAVMQGGRIVEQGDTDAVLTEPRDDYTRALLAAVPVPDPVVQRRRRSVAPAGTAWREWRARRDAEFADPYGWLSLTALEWLDEAPRVLDGLPGRWWLDAEGIHAVVAATDELLVDDRVASGPTLLWDGEGSAPAVTHRGRRLELVVRGPELSGVRVRDPQAPALRAFTGVPAFDYDPAWRVPATYRAYPQAEEVGVGSAAPRVRHTQVVTGEVTFTIDGSPQRLRVNDGTWIAFRDATTGRESNPNCRWVDVDTSAADVVVDFNFAANPPCAFTDYGTCPLPPAGNVLDAAVLAGERDPRPGR